MGWPASSDDDPVKTLFDSPPQTMLRPAATDRYHATRMIPRLRFDRHEFAGSFGDIGTDLPLLMAMIIAADLDAPSVFLIFGILQIASGIFYGLPMPLQPLKAMAVIVITQKISGDVIFGAGLAIAVIMLFLSLSGLLTWLARAVPRCVVRGIQLGLGLSLASLALRQYVPSMQTHGYILAGVCFLAAVVLWGNRRVPAALVVIGIGALHACVFSLDVSVIASGAGLTLPTPRIPEWQAIWTGLFVLALPQLPLSISNSVIATHQTLHDLFPERSLSVRAIGLTYSCANAIASVLGGVPVCHGCGGLAGHHAFGARTGGSVVIYGSLYLLLGLLGGDALGHIVGAFPQPVLGVILLFEAAALMVLVRDIAANRTHLLIAFIVAAAAASLPQGFIVGLIIGCVLYVVWGRTRPFGESHGQT
jgi:xanthine/uracil/vitamin C permease (AzgA family)